MYNTMTIFKRENTAIYLDIKFVVHTYMNKKAWCSKEGKIEKKNKDYSEKQNDVLFGKLPASVLCEIQ